MSASWTITFYRFRRERYKEINLHEPEEEEFLVEWMEKQGKSPVILDIGAAVGYYSILLKKKMPEAQMHCFEPLPRHRECIRANAQLNGISYESLNVREEALSDTTSTVEFRDSDYSSRIEGDAGRHLGALVRMKNFIRRSLHKTATDNPKLISVNTLTLDDYLDIHSIDPDLVKMDVQGFETSVLIGSAKTLAEKRVKQWIIGTHSSDIHAFCANTLKRNGYNLIVNQEESVSQPDGIIVATA